MTLSTISLDSRTDLPKVRYATALDWFLLMSFFYCIATLLEFAGVHYFTKVGSGEIPIDQSDWEEWEDEKPDKDYNDELSPMATYSPQTVHPELSARRRGSMLCSIYNVSNRHCWQ